MLFSFLFLPICLSVSVFSFFNIYIFLYFFSLSVSISISHTYIFFLYCSTLYKTQSEFAYGFFCAVRALARTRARTNARARKRRWSLWERPGWHQAEEVFNISTIFYPLKFPQSIWGVFEKCCANSDFCSTINHIDCPHNQHLILKAVLRSKEFKMYFLEKKKFLIPYKS
jgi:hypothetical protein